MMKTASLLLMASLTMPLPVIAGEDASSPQADFFVATGGNDQWSGRLSEPNPAKTDGPLATLQRARDAVRTQKDGGLTAPITVLVRGGTYYLTEPLRFGPEDSGTPLCPITYRAYPGETPVLSGGRRITGWRSDDGRIYFADIPEARERKWFFRQLRVGDEPQVRARTPNYEPLAWARYPRFPELVRQLLARSPGFDPRPAACYTGGHYLTASPEEAGGEFGYGVRHISQQGVRLEYPLSVPADGHYHVWLRYANAADPSQDMSGRTAIGVVGGEPVPLDDIGPTGEELRWARAGRIALAAGKHTLRWENVEGGELALDAIALCDDPDYEPQLVNQLDLSPPAPGKHLVVVQAECYEAQHGRKVRPWEEHARLEEWSAYPARRTTLRFRPGTLSPMPASSDVEVLFFPEAGWINAIARLEKTDTHRGVLTVSGANCTRLIVPHNRFCFVNALEALDTPGEWCLNGETGRVYLWPMRTNFETLGVVAPVLDYAIELAGDPDKDQYVSWVHIEGFTVVDTGFGAVDTLEDPYFPSDAAVWLRGAAHCRIVNNTVRDVGGYGVCLAGPSHHNQVMGNRIYRAGQGGVHLNGSRSTVTPRAPAPEDRRPRDNLISGNHIHDCGAFYKHVGGVLLMYADDNVVSHNLIHDMPRYGVSIKWTSGGNRVEFNEIRRTVLETSDAGAIETANNNGGGVIHSNLLVDTIGVGYSGSLRRIVADYMTHGIYLDNAASGFTVTNNIVLRVGQGNLAGAGSRNLVENNIFLANSRHHPQLIIGGQTAGGYTLRRNILGWSNWQVSWLNGQKNPGVLMSDYNLFYNMGSIPGYSATTTAPPSGKAQSLDEWRKDGQDVHSVVADPLFVDVANGDFRLKPQSPALALGFQQIEVERIGLRGYRDPGQGRQAQP